MGHTYDKVFTKRKRKQKFNPSREIVEKAVSEYQKKGGQIRKIERELDYEFHNSYRSAKAMSISEII